MFGVLITTNLNVFLFSVDQSGEKSCQKVTLLKERIQEMKQTCSRRFARRQGRAFQLWMKKWGVLFVLHHVVHMFIV